MKKLICIVALTTQVCIAGAAGAQTVLEKPASISSLTDAWQWGVEQAQDQSAAWVAYGFSALLDEKLQVALSSRHEHYIEWNRASRNRWWGEWYSSNQSGWQNKHSLAALQTGNASTQMDYVVQHELLFLARFVDGEAEALHVLPQDALMNWGNTSVYWLGEFSEEESFQHHLQLLATSESESIRRTLVRSLGLHDSQERNGTLVGLIEDENQANLQWAAIESLAMRKSPQVAAFLTDIARDENADLSARRIAISALSRYDTPANIQLLAELSTQLNPQAVRREAVESLSIMPGDTSSEILRELIAVDDDRHVVIEALSGLSIRPGEFETIADVAESNRDDHIREVAMELAADMDGERAFPLLQDLFEDDPNRDLREEALQAMDNVPSELAIPYLLEVANAAGRYDGEMRAEAVDTLAEFDASLVLDDLNRLAWSDSNEDVREDAVRAMADLDDPAVGNLLLDIARNHPSNHTRREALDELEDRVL
ncbi:MAG: HEAT repeat domain-containing protein [Pseudomonadales bacterium]|nr:HEAT repeat domain-containing protein [Pseudomonadales bacterium]